ncbi:MULTISPECIES: amyloid fiber anchoring/assembly protein TapA [Bacillaceae]|uniref:amyloid fiber anchoring/assembly protein TapA n=1 Tax=Bacillaceae TaxID=186817 RepID=UPI001F5F56C5|nr:MULTISPECIES: amyloid fiber anchoring/assembly protein TapA [Bacillaceae]
MIRKTRLKKFRKKYKKIKLASQILAIWYVLMFTVGYLSSDTGAYFNSSSQIGGTITVGTWQEEWDKSSLEFVNKEKDQLFTTCEAVEISAAIKNSGNDMKGQSQYEVFYNDRKNPKDGQKIGEGMVEALKSGETGTLKFSVDKSGNYKFKALQRPGHANKYDTRKELWSETITVKCQTPNPKENEERLKTQSPTENGITPKNNQQQPTEGLEANVQPPQSEGTTEKTQPSANEKDESKQNDAPENQNDSDS